MTYAKLLGFGGVLIITLLVLKIVLIGLFAWEGSILLPLLFWLLVGALAVAAARRLGVITMLEAVVVICFWLLVQLILDVLIAGPVLGFGIFLDPDLAIGYLVFALSILFFHKKRHVLRRDELAQK